LLRNSRRQTYAMKKIPTFDILGHRSHSWFGLSSITRAGADAHRSDEQFLQILLAAC